MHPRNENRYLCLVLYDGVLGAYVKLFVPHNLFWFRNLFGALTHTLSHQNKVPVDGCTVPQAFNPLSCSVFTSSRFSP